MKPKLPYCPEELLEYLEKIFPQSIPTVPPEDPNELYVRCGQAQVISKMRDLIKKQLEN